MRLALGSLAMICATAIAIAFLKYWLPFEQFRMHFFQQERILELLEQASKPRDPRIPQKIGTPFHEIKYVSPVWQPYPPPPDPSVP